MIRLLYNSELEFGTFVITIAFSPIRSAASRLLCSLIMDRARNRRKLERYPTRPPIICTQPLFSTQRQEHDSEMSSLSSVPGAYSRATYDPSKCYMPFSNLLSDIPICRFSLGSVRQKPRKAISATKRDTTYSAGPCLRGLEFL